MFSQYVYPYLLFICVFCILGQLFLQAVSKHNAKARLQPHMSPPKPKFKSQKPHTKLSSTANEYAVKLKQASSSSPSQRSELSVLKEMYHKIQNLETYPDVLPAARNLLIKMLSQALEESTQNPRCLFLSLEEYSPVELALTMDQIRADIAQQWDDYLARRRAGAPKDLFGTSTAAKHYLENLAPAKCVDGAWLGHIHRVTTPFASRASTVGAWQVLSEELGDGDLEKHHVHIYTQLLKQIGSDLPEAHEADFINPDHGLENIAAWRAAVAQLLISLFPHEFLPEILGFNLHFEGITMATLKTAYELKEVGIDPNYFVLHITIDNADSGHSAIAAQTITTLLETVRQQHGEEEVQNTWRRVQAGYVLSERCDSSMDLPSALKQQRTSFHSRLAEQVAKIFAAKATASRGLHCTCRMRVGRRLLVEWLAPESICDRQWQIDFLEDLSNCKFLVKRGDAKSSKLIRDLRWGGKMFGSFTHAEVEIVKLWIATLDDEPESNFYWDFTGLNKEDVANIAPGAIQSDIRLAYPVFSPQKIGILDELKPSSHSFDFTLRSISHGDLPKLLPIWFTQQCLLEGMASVPSKSANTLICLVIRLLRCQYGFNKELDVVAGMDEARRINRTGLVDIGLELAHMYGATDLNSLGDVLDRWPSEFCTDMLHFSMRPFENKWILLGMSKAFLALHDAVTKSDLLSPTIAEALRQIVIREREIFDACVAELGNNKQSVEDFSKGFAFVERELSQHFAVGNAEI